MYTAIREFSWHTFCCLDNIQPPQNQHEASNTTSTAGQMAEAPCACRLWARKLSRESSYCWATLPALKFLQLKIGAKENLQAVQHELCSAQRWKTKIKTIKPVTLSKQVSKSHKLLLRYWGILFKIDAMCILSLLHWVNYSWCFQAWRVSQPWSSYKHKHKVLEMLLAGSVLHTSTQVLLSPISKSKCLKEWWETHQVTKSSVAENVFSAPCPRGRSYMCQRQSPSKTMTLVCVSFSEYHTGLKTTVTTMKMNSASNALYQFCI